MNNTTQTPSASRQASGLAGLAAICIIGLGSMPAVAASPPDITVQVLACLPFNGLTADQLKTNLLAELQAFAPSSGGLIKSPDVIPACVGGHEVVGIWLHGPGSANTLKGLNILAPKLAFFGIQLTASGATNSVANIWNQDPHRLDDSGNADRRGNIELKGTTLSFTPAKAEVTLAVNGEYYISPGISPTFKISFVDDLSIIANEPACTHSQAFSYQANALWAGLSFLPLPFTAVPVDEIEAAFDSESGELLGDPELQAISIGCYFASLVPAEILLPGTSEKIAFAYDSVSVNPVDGIVFFSVDENNVPHMAARQPAVLTAVPFVAPVEKSEAAGPVSARLLVKLHDLRQGTGSEPQIKITWTSTGKVDSNADGGLYGLVTFPALPVNRRSVGAQTKVGTVTVSAVDADGIKGTGTFDVFAQVIPDPIGIAKPPTNPVKPIER